MATNKEATVGHKSETPLMPREIAELGFMNAAAGAGLFELRVRMLVDQTPTLQARFGQDLGALINAVREEYQANLLPGEGDFLSACALLRSKLLHVELSKVSGRVEDFGSELRKNSVTKIDLDTGEVRPVAGTKTKTGRVYGWLLECQGNGTFDEAARHFRTCLNTVDRLVDALNAREAVE